MAFLPRFGGGGGLDRVTGLLVEAAFHERHDHDLAAVEEAVADAAVRGHGFGGLGPAADPCHGSGAVDEDDDPQLLADLPVVRFRVHQHRQLDRVAADLGCAALLCCAVQPREYVVGGFAVALTGQQPGDVD